MTHDEIDHAGSLLTRDEVAAWLKLSPKRVYDLPVPRVKLGRRTIRWRKADIEEFIARRTTD
ncbi:MAG: helix-turn-helix domain-containing protein [Gemmatimonadota bacterium]|nr:MAG: helix-turn-helix domain-containing protein [Gemmatimonadota bacterium]